MPDLLIKFKLELEYHPIRSGVLYFPHPNGPLFHRWLPNGMGDAIELDTNDFKASLKIWFERYGYLDNELIKFDRNRKEVDLLDISVQGKLDAGPLFGLLEIRDLSDMEARSLKEFETLREEHNLLEKRIIRLLYVPVRRFINILRVKYGQYWLPEIEAWDSRKVSAGVYIRSFGFPRWSLDGGLTWDTFQYTELRLSVGKLRKNQDFREYLSKKDWEEISKFQQSDWAESLAISTVIRAIELFDNGQYKYAIIEAVTALEMVLNDVLLIRVISEPLEYTFSLKSLPFIAQLVFDLTVKVRSTAAEQSLQITQENAIKRFRDLGVSDQFNVIANLFSIPDNDRQATINLIKIRNKIVHEGKEPPDSIFPEFSGFLNCIERLYLDRQLRFPMAGSGNRKMSQQEWENYTNE